ncbi:MAG TPA: ACP S-malonyltransferase [Candidatus Baltobacteraceae bacterium]
MSKRARVAAIFPGQGSQLVGMGVDVAANDAGAKRLFERAAGLLGYDLLALVSTGSDEALRETKVSQPAIFVTNVALYTAVGELLAPVVTAGHSFGEFCSLTVSGALSFDDAVRVVDQRGRAMQAAADVVPGGMSAVLGLDAQTIRDVVATVREGTGLRVQLANFNSPTQIVISGDLEGVRIAGEAMLAAGAKRVVALNVSGAWHSALMEPAIDRFAQAVADATFALPRFDVIGNVDAQPYRDTATIERNLVASITDEVRWHETAERLLSYDLDLVVEFGASPVLGPLMKRMPGAPDATSVGDFAGVIKLREKLAALQGDAVEV